MKPVDADALMRGYGNPDIKILLDNMPTLYRNFTDLTDEEVLKLAKGVFGASDVRNITRHKEDDAISFEMKTEGWGEEGLSMWDDVTLNIPFGAGEDAIYIKDMEVGQEEYRLFTQFCFANWIFPEWYRKNNPFMEEKS